jgi:hypothetical protein
MKPTFLNRTASGWLRAALLLSAIAAVQPINAQKSARR